MWNKETKKAYTFEELRVTEDDKRKGKEHVCSSEPIKK